MKKTYQRQTIKPQAVSLYNSNMAVFKERYPQYADMVHNSKLSTDFEIRKTNIHVPTLFYKPKEIYLYDKDNPVQTCADNAVSYEIHHCRMAIYLGFGMGYDSVYHTEKMSDVLKTEQILIIEHDPAIIKTAMKYLELKEFFKSDRVELMLGHSEEQLFNMFAKWLTTGQKFYLLRASKFMYNMQYYELYKDYYAKVADTFRRAAQYAIMYYGNDPKDSIIGIENMFANLQEIINNGGINLLKDKFKGVPAVCVATGPSLDKNMHLLKGLENKAVIIAADASLKPMLDKGLKPHMITTLEREMAIVDLFKDIPKDLYDDVYLCGCPVIYNEVYQVYAGPRIIAYRMFDHFKWLGIERGLLEIKLSSGNMNFKIAEYLGCNPIILIGQDLALQGGKTNADGAVLGTEQVSYLNEPRLTVKGNYQDTIETTRSLNMMLEAYGYDVADYQGECINATEGGAHIPGTKLMTFEEAIKGLDKNYEIKKTIDDIMGSFVAKEDETKTVKANIEKSLEHFKNALDACQQAIDWLKENEERIIECTTVADKEYIEPLFAKMWTYRAEMQKEEYTWQKFFAHISQSVFVNYEMLMNSLLMDNKDINIAQAKGLLETLKFFKLTGGMIKVCIKMLEEERGKL